MKKYIQPIIRLIISFLFLYCFHTLYYGSALNAVYQNHNIFTIPVYIGICCVSFKGWGLYAGLSDRKWLFPGLGLLYSIFFVSGTYLMLYTAITFRSWFFWLCIIVFAYVMTAFILVFYFLLLPWLHSILVTKTYSKLDYLYHKVNFVSLWVTIFICWIPVLLAFYPGIFSYDAKWQCSQVGEILKLTSHHPVIHTLFLGGCVYFGKSVLHSANTGLLLYSLVQMLINSAIFAYCLVYIKKLKASSIVFIGCFIFYALIPFNSLFSICATKDVIFASLFLLFAILLCKIAFNPTDFFSSWKQSVAFICICFMLLIFRNNMLYAFLISIPFLLIIYRRYWKHMAVILIVPILLLKLYEGLLYPVLQVSPGNSREAYSVIMQQYACVYNECTLDEADRELLLELMDDASWKKYEPHKSDAVKDHFNTRNFEDNIGDYISLWVKLGIQHPSQYINAFMNLTYGYWYPNDVLPDTTTYRKFIEISDGDDITFNSKWPWLFDKLYYFGMGSSYQKLPVLSMLFSPAAYVWTILFLCIVCLYHRRCRFFSVMVVPAALFLTILLGPVALLRYIYPIVLCVPLYCVLCSGLRD